MSAPRTKRQFAGAASDPAQRHITAFFNKSAGTSGLSTSPPSSSDPAALSVPSLPASVQSNLLSVGMRVRKSVPEGYKTGTHYSGFSLWADAVPATNHPVPAVPGAVSTTAPSRHELLPFCGIHKVGGLAAQPAFDAPPTFSLTEDIFNPAAVPALDDLPSLTSSQESVESNGSSLLLSTVGPAATNRKRLYSDDDDNDELESSAPAVSDRLQVRRSDWLDGEVSPRSLAPVGWENARVVAVPRRRSGARKSHPGAGPGAGVQLADLGQENMAMNDFEEAEFLDYGSWGQDLDMSGV